MEKLQGREEAVPRTLLDVTRLQCRNPRAVLLVFHGEHSEMAIRAIADAGC